MNAIKFDIRWTLESVDRVDTKSKGDRFCMKDSGRRADSSPKDARGSRLGSRGMVRICVKMNSIESLENAGSGTVINATRRGKAGAFFFSTGCLDSKMSVRLQNQL